MFLASIFEFLKTQFFLSLYDEAEFNTGVLFKMDIKLQP